MSKKITTNIIRDLLEKNDITNNEIFSDDRREAINKIANLFETKDFIEESDI